MMLLPRVKIHLKWILLLWICSTALNLLGQLAASFQYLSKKDGLSQVSVFAVAQDDAGFMWFGTKDGLNKFDGYQFKIYKNNTSPNSLIANDIRTLYIEPKNKYLWIGTTSGLSKYQVNTDDFVNYIHSPSDDSSISNNVIRTIYKDSKDRLWIGTAVGLNLYDEANNNFKKFHLDDKIAGAQDVKAIIEDAAHQLWFGTSNGLYKLLENQDGSLIFERLDDNISRQLSGLHIKSILEDKERNFWIGTYKQGINYWDRKKDVVRIYKSKKDTPTSLSHNNIRSMCLDQKGNLWVGTFNGLNFLAKGSQYFIHYSKKEHGTTGLSDKSVRSVFIDKQGSLWLGTYYGGINHLDKNYGRFQNFRHSLAKNTLSSDVVSSFAEDNNNSLWIGTEGGGLNYYDFKTGKFKSYQFQEEQINSLSGNNVKELLLDKNKLWIGTYQAGLNLFDIEKQTFQHFKHDPQNNNSLSNNNVYGLHKENDKLWISTYGGGLDILDLKHKQFYNYSHKSGNNKSLSSDQTRVLLQTRDKQLWIGTEKGLNKINLNAHGFPLNFDLFLAGEKIYTLQEDVHSNIWIGTISNGLYCLNPITQDIQHFTTEEGLPGNTIFGILETNENELWLSTNNGLSKFQPKQITFTNYSYSDGLKNAEYNFNAYYKTESGDFLFGGINGFTRFNPNTIQQNEFIPPIAFTELRRNNKVVPIKENRGCLKQNINNTEQIIFKYNEANFSISFAALDYFSPENNRYAFILEGLDNNWNHTRGKTEATYTIQREGDYIFRLRGGNSDGLWNPNERQLKIRVLPPPWRTNWAYFLYVVAICLLFYALYRFIHLRHKLDLQQIAKQQQEELHEVKLRFFTNITHEFRTPLTLILGPLKELINKEKHSQNVGNQLSLIERNAERLLNLVNQVLTFRKLAADHEPMKVINGNIVLFLKEIFLPFQKSADLKGVNYIFKTTSNQINAWYDQDKLEKVFFNLLSNAFKFTQEGGQIEMHIEEKDEFIVVKIIDNGQGIDPRVRKQIFKRFYEKANSAFSSVKGSGIGLAISKQMVELHKGAIFVENKGAHRGTTIVVQLPQGRKHFKEEEVIEGLFDPEQIMDYSPLIDAQQDVSAFLQTENKIIDTQSRLLLIVEDNEEIQGYIKQIFAKDYRLITANNGLEGLQKAKKHLPDLIISDVMMPKMDGITFCGQLKTNIEISHIPIVLLTARTAALFKIEGLKTGADDYVTKPFNPEELRLRVRNIIQSRQDTRDKFARILTFDPKEISITSADEQFLENALQLVEKHIENYEFNVLQFASELAVSRPLLFTKLKALTGQTPNNFIKTIRLKRAAQLLKTKKLNVSEVAYKVGFKDPKYFRKCFQQQFDILPSKYGEE